MAVEFHSAAEQELDAAAAFYERRREGLGLGLLSEVEDVCALISEYAAIGRRVEFYNTRRPHSSLDGVTPDRFYFDSLPMHLAAYPAAMSTYPTRCSCSEERGQLTRAPRFIGQRVAAQLGR
jgi:hypothetical protein